MTQPATLLEETNAIVPATTPDVGSSLVLMFERLATNPQVDVAKLEKLIEMQERIIRHNARAEFWSDFARMQGELPTVSERGEIVVNGQVRSKYATNEDIQQTIRPILQKHGFALSFRNEFADGYVKIIGILAHRSGHSEQDEFVARADTSGSKNDIQALGSTRSYGQRYTTIALLNIATRGEDDDGRTAQPERTIQAPAGFEDWWTDLQATAADGIKALTAAWNASKADYRNHVMATNKSAWQQVKARAEKAGK